MSGLLGREQRLAGFCLAMCILVGCGKGSSGVMSQGDYAYAVGTPEEVAEARARFEKTLEYFESAGFRVESVDRGEERSEAVLEEGGRKVRLVLLFPGNGFATVTLGYTYEGTEAGAKAEAERVLARAQGLLTPGQPVSIGE